MIKIEEIYIQITSEFTSLVYLKMSYKLYKIKIISIHSTLDKQHD